MSDIVKCATCLYKKNCQFLATHKRTVVSDCTAYENAEDMVKLRHGHWVHKNNEMYCSVCGEEALMDEVYYESPYCPECGTKMDRKDDN